MRADTQQAAITCCETLGIRETARRLGVNHESVRNWAAGRSDPSDTNATAMRALAKELASEEKAD
jgi:DNA-binding transcriptional regulator YiaG